MSKTAAERVQAIETHKTESNKPPERLWIHGWSVRSQCLLKLLI